MIPQAWDPGRLLTVAMYVVALAPALALSAQAPGTPLSVARNATAVPKLLPTVSIESGVYRHRVERVAPVSVRLGIDYRALSVSVAGGPLLGTEPGAPDGFGLGLGAALDLWPPGKTSYWAFGGRLAGAVSYSQFEGPGGTSRQQLDVPVALALAHKLPPLEFTVLPWIAPRLQGRLVDDGAGSDFRWLAGGSLGLEIVKARCAPGRTCVYGWGARLAGELVGDLGGGALEGGVTLGVLWKFF